MNRDAYQLQGQNGGVVLETGDSWSAITNNDDRAASFAVIAEDAVLSELIGNLADSSTKLTGKTLVAGLPIGGQITEIAVTSGTVVLYY